MLRRWRRLAFVYAIVSQTSAGEKPVFRAIREDGLTLNFLNALNFLRHDINQSTYAH